MALDKWMLLYPVLLLFVFNAGYTEAQNSTSTSKTTSKATTTASKPTTKITTASTTRATTKPPTTTPKSSPSTAKATTKISTASATTKPVTTEETPCECKQPDDVPFIVVTTFLTICLLGYVALAAYLIDQRYRKSPLENDARNVEGTNANDYTTTPNASGVFYENVILQNHRPENSERSSQDDSNLYQHLSPIDRPMTIYETVLTHKNNVDIVGDFR